MPRKALGAGVGLGVALVAGAVALRRPEPHALRGPRGATQGVASTAPAPSATVSEAPATPAERHPRCPASGLLHGPWSLRPTEHGALVRWDACAETARELVVTPELGGAARRFTAQHRRALIRVKHAPEGVAPDHPGERHLVEFTLDGLAPGTCYRYRLASPSDHQENPKPAARSGDGGGGRVCTARAPGEGFVFLALGDTFVSRGATKRLWPHLLGSTTFGVRPDLTLHLGDMQYYDQTVESHASWFPEIAPLLELGALAPAVGNHELELPHELDDYYLRLFADAARDGSGTRYRFSSGGIHFFSLDTEQDLSPESPQGKWLEGELAVAASTPGHRASVVYFHKPWITLSGYPNLPELRRHYHAAFRRHGVRLVLQGHVHGYERFEEAGVTYVVSGGGGAALHDLDVTVKARADEASARRKHAKRHHGTLVRVREDAFEARVVADDGSVLDDFRVPFASGPPR
ncbi:MAG: metallophosphoesterase [Deltaproteobacteria bacterium]|nr:metallophosphoesterase [Deltaproteobacteria bacterium]